MRLSNERFFFLFIHTRRKYDINTVLPIGGDYIVESGEKKCRVKLHAFSMRIVSTKQNFFNYIGEARVLEICVPIIIVCRATRKHNLTRDLPKARTPGLCTKLHRLF